MSAAENSCVCAIPFPEDSRPERETARRFFPVSGIALLLGVYLVYDAVCYSMPGPAAALAYAQCGLVLAVAVVNLRWESTSLSCPWCSPTKYPVTSGNSPAIPA